MSENLEQLKGKNWVASMALCWFLGYFGAHRFYTGKQNSAWIMLVLTILGITAPISAIWSVIDGFMIALGKYKHEDGSELYERIDWLGYVYIALVILGILACVLYFIFIIAMTAAIFSAAGSGVNP